MRLERFLLCLLLLTLAAPATAQPEPRPIAVPAGSDWRHAATGMLLPAAANGLSRAEVQDSGSAELDLVATYINRDEGVIALVYIYRTMTPNVALWFDRALAPIVLQQGAVAAPGISGFIRPGASAASGLRAALPDNVAGMRSTAIAVAPLGDWLVKIRLGSNRLEPAALNERLSAFVAALGWPAEAGTARPAAPVAPCATPLRFRNARIIRTQVEDMLMDSVATSIEPEEQEESGPPPIYCRERGATAERGVYRPNSATDQYLLAIGDAGIAIAVGEALDLSALLGDGRSRRRYSVILLERNSSAVFPSFNRLPAPEQVLALVRSGSALSTTVGD